MKRFAIIICMVFLCFLYYPTVAQASVDSFEVGAGITFEGELPPDEEQPEEKDPPKGEEPETRSPKPSLPQTGQESSMILPAAGGMLLIIAYGQILVRSGKNRLSCM